MSIKRRTDLSGLALRRAGHSALVLNEEGGNGIEQ